MTDVSLKEQLTAAMKDAMRAKAKARLGAIRLIQSEIKRIEVDERVEVDDARVLAVLDKMKKQRKDSIEQFTAGGRPELAEIEAAEIAVIEEFMPAALGADEIDQLINAALAETGASSIKDMGKVMAMLKPQLQGRADMGQVSQQIKAALTS
ncbi:MAG: GatB/YqeY domain-containing protein [Pseudomonadales bacterium]